ncbi:MAG: DUF368 domain-containing protein [Clostridia bacterium]|nr:DUF368 domain-containing protein [Clostridia bacterium]
MNGWIKNLFLGFLIGGTMSVPGVSGGTTALALGCYDDILSAAASLRKKGSVLYLVRLLLGGILGFFSIAGFLNDALRIVPLTMTMLFLAAAGTGLFFLGKEALAGGISINGVLLFVLGFCAVVAVDQIPKGNGSSSFLLMILWGILLAAGIILPGISTSHLLLVFGLYDDVSNLTEAGTWKVLLPLGLGVGIGMLLLTKPLAAALNKYPSHCRFALLGFATASLKALIQPCLSNPQTAYLPWFQVANGIILGFGAIWGMMKLHEMEKKLKKL